jgi:hypothetical protein
VEKVIPTASGPIFDTDLSRISACLALIEIGKTKPQVKTKAEELLQKLVSGDSGKFGSDELSSQQLKEFARQAELYLKGTQKIEPTPLPTRSLQLTVKKIK